MAGIQNTAWNVAERGLCLAGRNDGVGACPTRLEVILAPRDVPCHHVATGRGGWERLGRNVVLPPWAHVIRASAEFGSSVGRHAMIGYWRYRLFPRYGFASRVGGLARQATRTGNSNATHQYLCNCSHGFVLWYRFGWRAAKVG